MDVEGGGVQAHTNVFFSYIFIFSIFFFFDSVYSIVLFPRIEPVGEPYSEVC